MKCCLVVELKLLFASLARPLSDWLVAVVKKSLVWASWNGIELSQFVWCNYWTQVYNVHTNINIRLKAIYLLHYFISQIEDGHFQEEGLYHDYDECVSNQESSFERLKPSKEIALS